MKTTPSDNEKINASILGGAIGDALGAPLEGETNFEKLFNMFGDIGVQKYIPAISPFDDKLTLELGETTDDTASVISTIAGLEYATINHQDMLPSLWQSQIIWASHQDGGAEIKKFIDPTIKWQDWFKLFFKSTGAGRGTLAALSQGRMGTLEDPIELNTIIRDKPVKGLNNGCGGMMRVAPIAFLPYDEDKIIDLALRSTAITHGSKDAQDSAAVIALTIRNVFNGHSLTDSARHAVISINNNSCSRAFAIAFNHSANLPSCRIVNNVGRATGYKNQFQCIPVLAQVLYGTMLADQIKDAFANRADAMKQTLSYVSTIAGDSDSVASMVGNILGAAWGISSLPSDLLNNLKNKDAISIAANSLFETCERISKELRAPS